MYDTLTQEQLNVFQAIGPLMGDESDPSTSKVFFVDGPGGSGKTYLYTFLIHYIKSHNVKVMSSAMTGIAAILLPDGQPDGQTAHRTFSIPVPCLDNTAEYPLHLHMLNNSDKLSCLLSTKHLCSPNINSKPSIVC